MSKAFLLQLAEKLLAKYGTDINDVAVVLPNRRAALFLRHHLASLSNEAVFCPAILGVEDFISQLSGLSVPDSVALSFELYEVHCELEGKNAQPFDEFNQWGQQLLHDFNEIDLYMIDVQKLFGHLSEARALSLWNLDGKPLTDFEKNYLRFYESLGQYYDKLNQRLSNQNSAWQGQMYRHTAENIDELITSFPYSDIWFAGFNALTKSEEKIIFHLQQQQQCELLWDADDYTLNDSRQESGLFLRRYLKKGEHQSEDFKADKEIEIIGIPGQVAQVKKAGQILRDLVKDDQPMDSVALILADESLLLPMLNSIPEEIEKMNITMGLSLRNTQLADWLNSLMLLYDVAKNKQQSDTFYVRSILHLLSHPYLGILEDSRKLKKLRENLMLSNKVYLSREFLLEVFKTSGLAHISFYELLIQQQQQPLALNEQLQKMNFYLLSQLQQKKADEAVYLEQFQGLLNRMKLFSNIYKQPQTVNSFFRILDQMLSQSSISFFGEPLQGLQIMGVLESRTLDFDHVILLGANEGQLPAGRSNNSFIPLDIKQAFQLPSYREKDAIFAYHFSHLIQRNRKTHILYNSESGSQNGGDPSRFVQQLIHELPAYNPQVKITHHQDNLAISESLQKYEDLNIPKQEAHLQKLKEKAQKGFSPTSLSKWVGCKLRFYFSEIMKVPEILEVEENIQANTLGTVVHNCLEELYKPFIGKLIGEPELQQMQKLAKQELIKQFEQEYEGGDYQHGKNYLIYEVATTFVNRFLASEIKQLKGNELIVLDLEERFESAYDFGRFGIDKIILKGFADRIDRKNGKVRIIDYKTGKVEQNQLKLYNWADLLTNPKMDKAFQLLCYQWLWTKSGRKEEPGSGIISFRNHLAGYMELEYKLKEEQEYTSFDEVLEALFSEIFDPEIPFTATEDLKQCQWCPYIGICNKEE